MISTANITMQFGAKPLFEDVSIKFNNGNRYGLIGANGCGKSTFMKILGGDLEPSGGQVMLDSGTRLGKLRQDQFAYEEHRVIDTVIMGNTELWEVADERERIYSNPEMSEEDGMRVADLETRFAELDGYTAEARAGELLLGLGIPEAQHFGPMSEVSPGWKLRVLLAQALFSDPDVLLLDEPTNHLDINTIRWLEGVLIARSSTMVIISHDRHFLNSVCTHMADLDYGEIQLFPGNYDDYMTAATRPASACTPTTPRRRPKSPTCSLRQPLLGQRLQGQAGHLASAQDRQDPARRGQAVQPRQPLHPLRAEQEDPPRCGAGRSLAKGFDEGPLFKKLGLQIEAGERVAIIGPNGVGKTTLLRCLSGHLAPDAGEVKWTDAAEIGYFAQDHADDFANPATLYEWMAQWTDGGEQMIRGALGRMLFSNDEIGKSVKVISGGEQGRMLFGKLALQKPNVLLMDEPTNHLDMESIEALNLALDHYPGTLVFVSHDREFVSSLATRILDMSGDKIVDFSGSYDDYLKSQGVYG